MPQPYIDIPYFQRGSDITLSESKFMNIIGYTEELIYFGELIFNIVSYSPR
jgi:hypothetical protein